MSCRIYNKIISHVGSNQRQPTLFPAPSSESKCANQLHRRHDLNAKGFFQREQVAVLCDQERRVRRRGHEHPVARIAGEQVLRTFLPS